MNKITYIKIMQHLLKSVDARRIFGKKEIEITLKQLEGIDLTQSEKNRLSRDIRPKFDFIREISRFESEFALKKNQINRERIEKAREAILADEMAKKVSAVLLFGSYADGTFTKNSDIDICVIFDEISLAQATKFRIRISGQLSSKMDVHVFNVLPRNIKKSIAKKHRVLYKNAYFDNIGFTLQQTKDDGYMFRMQNMLGMRI